MLNKKIKRLLIGTNNKGKLKEIRDLLPKNIKTYSISKFKLKSPIENGKTFKENSLIKSIYFSKIKFGQVKAWKYHLKMTLNLVVPFGKVKFVFTRDKKHFDHYIIGEENYCRLTVPPWVWFGFQSNFNSTSLILNIADIEHDANEVDKKSIDHIVFDWKALK